MAMLLRATQCPVPTHCRAMEMSGTETGNAAIVLGVRYWRGACYAMSGTGIGYAATHVPRMCYGMSGTDIG
eukprot:1464555-Rhodomonas_salina.1